MHGAAFLTFPFPGDKERLEMCSHSLAEPGGRQRGPPWAGDTGEAAWGGPGGQQRCHRDVGSAGGDWGG